LFCCTWESKGVVCSIFLRGEEGWKWKINFFITFKYFNDLMMCNLFIGFD
jgi:hypothetical protein